MKIHNGCIHRSLKLPMLLLVFSAALAGCGGEEEPATAAVAASTSSAGPSTATTSFPDTSVPITPSTPAMEPETPPVVAPAPTPVTPSSTPSAPPASPVNRVPAITGTPLASIGAGAAYSFTPVATDADGDTLGFTITNKPSWATFNTATGRLTGTPNSSGVHASIVIRVSDGKATTALPSFTLTVTAAANRAPTISGTPTTSLNAGSAYSFLPASSDADGDTLTFSIVNKPVWAAFNTATGRLSGTPTGAQVGITSGIVISVSDGKTSSALSAFSIAVTQIATGSATLNWTPPTENTDGTPLTNLTGYRVYYGTNANALTQTVDISNASVSTYLLDNLSPATWHFAVKAIAGGVESSLSNVATKTIS